MPDNGDRSSREQVLEELRSGEQFVVITHENPDGDALGSLIAMQHILTALGKDSLMFIARDEFPLPHEYEFLPLDGLVRTPPDDLDDRTIVFLDCGNLDRNPAEAFKREDAAGFSVLNIDHHHDNTRFGTVNLVDAEASCTAEIVHGLMLELGVEPTTTIANALYVGLITDTGRFMYQNTGPAAHRMAAGLIEAGVDVHEIYRHVYEDVPYGKLLLLARALANVRRFDGGALTLTSLSEQDYADSGAEESYSEGVIDYLRAVDGTVVAGLVRARIGDANGARKVSLRASDERVDVSRIARARGGGGHRQAAGFTTEMEWDELVAFLREQVAQQLAVV
jgi:bifunctional oligoribonuclease and PAP phosphatase NrnA